MWGKIWNKYGFPKVNLGTSAWKNFTRRKSIKKSTIHCTLYLLIKRLIASLTTAFPYPYLNVDKTTLINPTLGTIVEEVKFTKRTQLIITHRSFQKQLCLDFEYNCREQQPPHLRDSNQNPTVPERLHNEWQQGNGNEVG